MWKNLKVQGERSSQSSKLQSGNSASNLSLDRRKMGLSDDQYAIMVSCRCNYSGRLVLPLCLLCCLMNVEVLICFCWSSDFVLNLASRLFFKQPTSWRPRTSRDILISVASDMSGQSPGLNERNSQLPVQVGISLSIMS